MSGLEELLICKVCLAEIKEEERCWLKGEDYCQPCINGDEKLKTELYECEKAMLEQLMEMVDVEGKKELLEHFGEYFGVQVIREEITAQ